MRGERVELPPRTGWAIDRLVKAARSEGCTAIQVGMNWDGHSTVGHVSLFDRDGNQKFYWHDGVNWFDGGRLDDGE